jgi:tRNA(Ile)-lysidine synthase
MLPDGCVVIALISGGADSVAMLRLLASGEFGDPERLRVLHVDHMLRGEASAEDAGFVRALCADLGVACASVAYDVAAYAAEESLNLEDAGRRVRYALADSEIDAACAALGADPALGRIAVAHTQDDRIETFLMRLTSGAGPGGLTGMRPVRGRIVRPLIDARRADVVAHLRALGQAWREDASNLDTSRSRAWVRHELVPLLESRNPSLADTLMRTIRLLAEEDDLLAEEVAAHVTALLRREGDAVTFDRKTLGALERPVLRRVLRSALIDAFPEASRIEAGHIEALAESIGVDGFARDLAFGLRAEAEYDRLRLFRTGADEPSVAPALLGLPGHAELGDGGAIDAREATPGSLAAGPERVYIDADAVTWPLVIDSPREGDRIRSLGMQGTSKLSDLLIDAKVPKRLRRSVPVVRDGSGIVWLAGVRQADAFKVTPGSARIAELVWERPEPGSGM